MFVNFYYIKSIYSDEHYVGSTKLELKERFRLHIVNFKAYRKGTRTDICKSFDLLNLGGCTIHLIDVVFCVTKEIKQKYEQHCMDTHPKELTNINRAFTSPEMKLEMDRQWRLDNHEYLTTVIDCECGGHYQYGSKSDHFKTDIHRDYLGLERLPQRKRNRKKEKTVTCACGDLLVGNLKRHMRSPKHNKEMMKINDVNVA